MCICIINHFQAECDISVYNLLLMINSSDHLVAQMFLSCVLSLLLHHSHHSSQSKPTTR